MGWRPEPVKPLLDPHQQTTLAVVAAWALSLAVYDALVAWHWGSSATVSWTLAVVSRRWPIVALFIGAVIGHIFLVKWAPDLLTIDNLIGLAVLLGGLAIGATMAAQKPDPRPSDESKDQG